MRIVFRVVRLIDSEVESLTESPRFNSFRPVNCNACGSKGPFRRQVFRVVGVRKTKQADDTVQALLRLHFSQKYGIEYVFFRTHGKRFFVDSAVCGLCGSTRIVFDIEITNAFLAAVSKLGGGCSPSDIRKSIEKIAEAIRMTDKDAEPPVPGGRTKRGG